MIVKLSPAHKLKYKIELVLVLEGVLHLDNEVTVQRCEQITLGHNMSDMILTDNQLLANTFHGIKHSVVFLLDQKNFAEGSLANNF